MVVLLAEQVVALVVSAVLVLTAYRPMAVATYANGISFRVEKTLHGARNLSRFVLSLKHTRSRLADWIYG